MPATDYLKDLWKAIKGKTDEQTGQQSPGGKGGGVWGSEDNITDPRPKAIETYREMRNQPTIAMARAASLLPMLTTPYATEEDGAPTGAKELIDESLAPLWPKLLQDASFVVDYGYSPFEIVYRVDGTRTYVKKLKPLLVDHTEVVVERKTGAFMGAKNGGRSLVGSNSGAMLPPAKVLWFAINQECQNYYGEGLMQRALDDYNKYREAEARMARYLQNAAGPVPMLEYPQGGTSRDASGAEGINYLMAQALVQALAKARGIVMPGAKAGDYKELLRAGAKPDDLKRWRFEFLETKSSHGGEYLDTLRYREVNMLRAFLTPERAVTEGQNGTKAEAESHAQLAAQMAFQYVLELMRTIDKYLINRLLMLNYGPEAVGTVRVSVADPDPIRTQLAVDILKGLLAAPNNADITESMVDLQAMIRAAGLPTNEE